MSTMDRSIPEERDRGALKYCCSDKCYHSGQYRSINNMANNFKGWNWEEVKIQEDKGHFGGSDKCFVEDLVQVEVLYQSAIPFFS
jgi:hypothetical protein